MRPLIELTLITDTWRILMNIVQPGFPHRIDGAQPTEVIESNLLRRTVDVHAKMTRFAKWLREEAVTRVEKVAMHTQMSVCLGSQRGLSLAAEVCVRVQQADCASIGATRPCMNHETTVEVRLAGK